MENEIHHEFHLAEIIEDELRERQWTLTDMVARMGPFKTERDYGICLLSWEFFMAIRDADVLLGEPMASELGKAFTVDPIFFENFHEAWRSAHRKVSDGE